MAADTVENQQKLEEHLKSSLRQAEGKLAGFRKSHIRLVTASVLSSGVTTLIAGVTAAVGQALQIGTEGWRTACIVAAIFGFVSTVSTGYSQQLKTSDRLAEGKQCVSQLKYLEAVLTTGSKSLPEVAKEYEDIVKTYPDFI